ncbi:MAG: tyrosine-type recombinase/integrase [Candidatus Brocadiaceae bacterium]|nr:tyrosine-type recombinase/integrase [Candidatus Brocadiaceae bacterium]
MRSLKSLFQVLADEQITVNNPFKKIKKYKASVSMHDVYSPILMSKILNYIRDRYPNLHLCCLLEYYCFLRPHYEIRLLKTGNINLRSRTILVHPETAKGGKARTIPIHTSLIPILEQRNLNQPYLFQIGDKPPCEDYFKNQFKRLRKKLNIPREYTLYGFKHTGVCALYRGTKDIYLVAK